MSTPDDKSLATMSMYEVATKLGCSVLRVRELIKTGKLSAVRTGGSDARPRGLLVSEEALRSYLASLPTVVPAGGSK